MQTRIYGIQFLTVLIRNYRYFKTWAILLTYLDFIILYLAWWYSCSFHKAGLWSAVKVVFTYGFRCSRFDNSQRYILSFWVFQPNFTLLALIFHLLSFLSDTAPEAHWKLDAGKQEIFGEEPFEILECLCSSYVCPEFALNERSVIKAPTLFILRTFWVSSARISWHTMVECCLAYLISYVLQLFGYLE